ncbi:MAG TPA: DegQ family serine endoprotease [Vicinamibacterales bacterium]|nr:DegQ family serine endoprotease [Vicinamibacterales bacterium]
MSGQFDIKRRFTRTGVAMGVAALLMAGAAWHGIAADQTVAPKAATVSTPIAHAIAGGRDSYADIVNVAAPAVVTIRTSGKAKVSPTQFDGQDPDDLFRRFFGDQFGRGQRMTPRTPRTRALGSGVIVTTDGYILTNNHVVENADEIKVDFNDDRTVTAKLVGTDRPSDLALLKVNASDLHPIALGNSDAVHVGDVVLALGNPLGVGQTVTMGIISAKGRSTGVGDGGYEDFLQTDAPINHGNSGGALVNTRGELVGINSQILSSNDGNIGIGFSIPVNMAKNVMEQLRAKGKVTRSQLGVTVQTVTSDLAESLGLKQTHGAVVSSVAPGSAAERAGVKRGDVIETFNGQAVHDTNTLRNRVAESTPGSTAELVIVRDGGEKKLAVKLDEANPEKLARGRGDRDSESNGSEDKTALGVSVAPLTPELRDRTRAPKDAQGLVVQDVDPDGRAAAAGVQPGDLIQEVNRQPVKSVEDLRAALKKTTDRPTLLLINRQGNDIFVTVRPANG